MKSTNKRVNLAILIACYTVIIVMLVLIGDFLWTVIKDMPAVWSSLSRAFIGLPPPLSAALVAGLVALVLSPLSTFLAKRWERNSYIEQEQRQKKIPVYEELMKFWFKSINQHKPGMAPLTPEDAAKFGSKFTPKLIVWGSDAIIKQYDDFQKKILLADSAKTVTPDGQPTVPPELLLNALDSLERVMMLIRLDIGYKNRGFKQRDILRLFINDIDQQAERTNAESAPTDTAAVNQEAGGQQTSR